MTVADDSPRQFVCARPACRALVRLCRRCDRGNIYCSRACAREARRESLHRAGARYQRSERGRQNRNARQQRWLDRRAEKMTHQGSHKPAVAPVLLPEVAVTTAMPADDLTAPKERGDESDEDAVARAERQVCAVCGRGCGPYVRLGPLRRVRRKQRRIPRHRRC